MAEAKRIRAKASTPHLRIFFDGQIGAYEDALAAAQLASEGKPLVWAGEAEQVAA
jgi:hypothetical protein